MERAFGFNLIGYLSSNSGVGVAARRLAELLIAHGHPVAGFDLHRDPSTGGKVEGIGAPCVTSLQDLPYAVNLFVVPIFTLKTLERELDVLFTDKTYFNAALCFWELPTIPPRWVAPLNRLDAIVATSDYMHQLYALGVEGPWVIPGLLPCEIPAGLEGDRERFGLPEDAVIFVSSFEPASDSTRKNAMGVLDSFMRGPGNDPRAFLALKIKNALIDGREHPIVAALRDKAGRARVKIMTEDFTYSEVLSLYKTCDVFVSLHRAEGLGLGLLEAMALGKPVIATGWSGNMSFMDHSNSCLVRYRLVPVEASTKAYATEMLEDTTIWAEPDAEHAAAWMTLLTDRPDIRKSIGEAAATRYVAYQADAMRGSFLSELKAVQEHSKLSGMRPNDWTAGESTEGRRVGRLARIHELERELAWITSRPIYRLTRSLKNLLGD